MLRRECYRLSDSELLSKTRKNILDLGRFIQQFETGKGSTSLATSIDRLISEIRRAAVKVSFSKRVVSVKVDMN